MNHLPLFETALIFVGQASRRVADQPKCSLLFFLLAYVAVNPHAS